MGMDFSMALGMIKNGEALTREGWNGRGMYVFYQCGVGGVSGQRLLPYLMFKTAEGDQVPWLASQTDMLAHDWVLARLE